MKGGTRLVTVRDFLRYAVSRFNKARLHFGHGTDNVYDEAAYLILHTLRLPLDALEPFLDTRLTENQREAVLHIIERRVAERVPAAYLTREAWLGDSRFYVDERVIVPRSHIAELLREKLSPWVSRPGSIRSALDLCTGSGCLAILLALSFPNARIEASDISQDALKVARRNVADYGLEKRIRLVRSDGFEQLGKKRYDLIIANPPYVNAKAMRALPQEYRHEPRAALAGGADGLDAIRVILREAGRYLAKAGLLVVEAGDNRHALEAAFPGAGFTWLTTSAGEDYVFLLGREQLPG